MIPVNDVKPTDAPTRPEEMYRGMNNLDTLMVEPSVPQQKLIREQFEGQGIFNINIVECGEAALEYITTSPPDLVVSTMYLPDMTGVDLLHALRTRDDFEYIPFLLISSETNAQWLEPIRQAGVVGVLPKPFASDDLHRALCAAYDLRVCSHLRESSGIDLHHVEVLLVDDSLMSRNHIRRVIENLGIVNIHEAENGR